MNEDDLMWDNIEQDVKGSSALNPLNGLTAEQAISQAPSIARNQAQQQAEAEQARAALAQQAESQEKQSLTQGIADYPDMAIGGAMGGAAANALTPKLEQQAMKQGMSKMAPWLARHVAPRLLGAAAGTSMGPVGTIAGLVAPELAYQAGDYLRNTLNAPPQPDTFSNPTERENYYRNDSQSTQVMPPQFPTLP